MMHTDALDFTTKAQFVDALLDCQAMQDRLTRDTIVSALKGVQGILRSDIDRTDVAKIVDRVLDFDGGMGQLVGVLRFYEGNSVHMQRVDELYAQHGKPVGDVPGQKQKPIDQVVSILLTSRLISALIGLFLLIGIAAAIFMLLQTTETPAPPTSTFIPTPTETLIPPTSTFTPIPTPTLGIGSTYVNPIDRATYVYVPVGEFIMGLSGDQVNYAYEFCTKHDSNCRRDWFEDTQPQHTVYLDNYWIMQTKVTKAQYYKFMDADGYMTETYWSLKGWEWRTRDNVTEPKNWNKDLSNNPDQPITDVNWYEAEAYANWLSAESKLDFGLPTEAQWEKAARGTDTPNLPSKNQSDCNLSEVPSPYGALDMARNGWEWTADWYDSHYYGASPSHNPVGPESRDHRVLRGGSWFKCFPYILYVIYRDERHPGQSKEDTGFRLVRHETAREN